MSEPRIILGIETSCDETSVAIVRDGTDVGANVITSSKQSFEKLAGVIPEEAARRQVECMVPVLREAFSQARLEVRDIDAISVTRGPGLLGSLLVGTVAARVLSTTWGKPLIGVHHTLGHLSSTWLRSKGAPPENIEFPIITLSASGGHTEIWYRSSHTQGSIIGRTRDDAAGEAFDKGASLLGLPYPGGPSIAKSAQSGNPLTYPFPCPLKNENTLDFSFSGLKTSLKYLLRDNPNAIQDAANVAASYQHAICTELVDRLVKAVMLHPEAKEIHLVGGVSANFHLRELTQSFSQMKGLKVRAPLSIAFCTDNAAMIAAAGFFLLHEQGKEAVQPFVTGASLRAENALRALQRR